MREKMLKTPISGILMFRRGLYYLKLVIKVCISTYEGFFCLQIKSNKLKKYISVPLKTKSLYLPI